MNELIEGKELTAEELSGVVGGCSARSGRSEHRRHHHRHHRGGYYGGYEGYGYGYGYDEGGYEEGYDYEERVRGVVIID